MNGHSGGSSPEARVVRLLLIFWAVAQLPAVATGQPGGSMTDTSPGRWSAVGDAAPNAPVLALASHEGRLYIGGDFTAIDGQPFRYVAVRDGDAWQMMDDGLAPASSPAVRAMSASSLGIFLGGLTGSADAPGVLMRWSGTSWERFGSVHVSDVLSLTSHRDELFVATSGFSITAGAARYRPGPTVLDSDGTLLHRCGYLVTASDIVGPIATRLLSTDAGVLVAGRFDGGQNPDGSMVASPNVLLWDGEQWVAVGGGLRFERGGPVSAVAADGTGRVFIGGSFVAEGRDPGQLEMRNVAVWNEDRWEGLGGGVNGTVTGIVTRGTDVFVGGDFTFAYQLSGDSVRVNRIARWDGMTWHSLGTGLDDPVRDMTVVDDYLYVGGDFSTAGGIRAPHLARWEVGLSTSMPDTEPLEAASISLDVFPSPSSGPITIRATLTSAARTRIVLYDLLGREVATLSDAVLGGGMHELQLDDRTLPPGVFLVVMDIGVTRISRPVVLAR